MSAVRPVVYVADFYPRLTQTFTTRDVRALHAAGLVDRVVSLHSPAAEDPPLDPALDPKTLYLPLPFGPQAALSSLAWLARRPLVTGGLALSSLLPHTIPFARAAQLRAPLHVLWGAHLASRSPPGAHFHAQFCGAASTVAWVASRLARGTFSMTVHQDWGLPHVRAKLRDALFVVAISETTRRELLAAAPHTPPERIVVSHVGVTMEREVADDATVARRPGPPRLLAVGGIGPTKGHDVLLAACHELARRGVAFHLDLVGGGDGLGDLGALAGRLGLGERATLHGARPHDDVRRLLRDADVVVLACRVSERGDRDGIPVALMEGMAAGKATVSTPVGAIPELIEDGVSGRLSPPDDPVALASVLQELLADERLRRRLGEGGRRRVADDFEAAASARRLTEIFMARLGLRDSGAATAPARRERA